MVVVKRLEGVSNPLRINFNDMGCLLNDMLSVFQRTEFGFRRSQDMWKRGKDCGKLAPKRSRGDVMSAEVSQKCLDVKSCCGSLGQCYAKNMNLNWRKD